MNDPNNPPVSGLLRGVTLVEAVVLLVAGVALFFLPSAAQPLWPWALTPFNAFFLGAVYLGSLVAVFLAVRSGKWQPNRVVVPMILLFTAIILAFSLAYRANFDGPAVSVGVWFLLYIVIPLNAGYHLWLYRRQSWASAQPPSPTWSGLLAAQAALLGLYGSAMMAAPAATTAFWPWPVDDFHGRMYSVAFLTPALGAFLLRRITAPIDWLTLGVTQLTLGVFSITGLVLVDISTQRVDWGSAGTWLWIAIFGAILLVGIGMVRQARQ